ncbi:hypothetical protein ABZ345_43730 [Lentzea sp. NPDC005914]|uniref:P-loop ATPase, Sll1717 family n=1 Tax=Lentzea sp. NPDC005914 TaxID=3154572 RepID=UPI0033FAE107
MAKSRRRRNLETTASQPMPQATSGPRLPKGGIDRINIGQAFAEYDPALEDERTYVQTPAYRTVQDFRSGKYFYVGRRGTGKTALRRFCDRSSDHTTVIVPEIFSPSYSLIDVDLFKDTNKKPFRSLVSAFRRALQDEILAMWRKDHPFYANIPPVIAQELDQFRDYDFDLRTLQFISRISRPLANHDDQAWLRENKMAKLIGDAMNTLDPGGGAKYTLLIDSIDDFWDGSEQALAYLTAFMHACLEMSSQIPWARAMMFLRENIFERVRERDSESSRIETAVVGLDWTEPQLVELVERRLNRPFNTKFALDGTTWNAFFEDGDTARQEILQFCQYRPRDVLIYVSYAVEAAQSQKHSRILTVDVLGARRRFSDNRLKDLGDEYAENYPQVILVLTRFYGLGRRFTVGGMESVLSRLLDDQEVKKACAAWIFRHATVESFVRLLYNIGFIGLRAPHKSTQFRALGSQDTSPPPVSYQTEVEVHRAYWSALDLQDVLVREMPQAAEFGRVGLLTELPDGATAAEYVERVDEVMTQLRGLPKGTEGASQFEDIVGDILRLCFYRSLNNIEARVRDVNGSVIRDWVCANRASDGFWEMVRSSYKAKQVIWECKNYEDLKSDDFHQLSYYMNDIIGKFIVVAYRGDAISPAYYSHIRRIAQDRGAFVLPLTERDLLTFLRQAKAGKAKEDHIQDRYDSVIRKIS